MYNGFYDTSVLKTIAKKKAFINNAMELSDAVRKECKYKNEGEWRRLETEVSLEEFLKDLYSSKDLKVYCIDRNMYNSGQITATKDVGEVGLGSTYNPKTGRLINADVNGSANILRKAIPNAFANGIEGILVFPVIINPKGYYRKQSS